MNQRTRTTFTHLALGLAMFSLNSCGGSNKMEMEPWVHYAEAAEGALAGGNIAEADRNANLMLQEADSSKYQGREPPISTSWEYKFLPTQGGIYYPDHLLQIAEGYDSAKRYGQAETFYRKAVDQEMRTCGNIPTTQRMAKELVLFLDARGKTNEANEVRRQFLSESTRDSSKQTTHP